VQGLKERDKGSSVRNLIREWKAYIVYLQETKMEYVSRAVVHSLWGCIHVD
jgi:hypothetical protein